ncbi:PhoX family phosphatase [Altererythrobacter sp. BO-6]|uniref:PhoX family protein n=1 Tax=Altererythrobacter sp. BO-6 TaxID=2604537 RepID=UPI0013E1E116|nr:PhoX family phosphatase [Altererythrobacter sp. BO-6]QIG52973.1 PhoX family phosphatase [Altererythrobacter sp. BO-6]
MDLSLHSGLYSDGDVDTNTSNNPSLGDMIEQRISRRSAILGGAKATGVAVFSSSLVAACGTGDSGAATLAVSPNGQTALSVSSGQMVSLESIASSGSASYTQAMGPQVELLEVEGRPGSFIAPAVSEPTTIQVNVRSAQGSATKTVPVEVVVNPAKLTFATVDKNFDDVVTVPAGYSVKVITALGDPIAAGVPAFKNDGSDTNFAQRIGDHGDALYYFGLGPNDKPNPNSSSRGLLAQNHENLNVQYLHPNGPSGLPRPEGEAIKEIEAHGVSVIELIDRGKRDWQTVQNSPFNRRITPNTPMQINGPVRGTSFVKTKYSPAGTDGRGTINNCANGVTKWNSLLTCEENWAGYFKRTGDAANRSAEELVALGRYGVSSSTGNYGWASVQAVNLPQDIFSRWDAGATTANPDDAVLDHRNEPNQFGWVVEIDPYDPSSTPRKRTALGRMGHEGAWMGKVANNQRLAVYMGDDARNEYFYKFVSATPWEQKDEKSDDRLGVGDKYLDNGTLCVAVFNADGTGQWKPLVFGQIPNATGYVFKSQADVLVHTRLAADAVGATTMDRPEWTACNPQTGEIYLTLTNNRQRNRPISQVNAANPRFYNDPPNTSSGNYGNPNGHIIRIREEGDDPASLTFRWDIYLFGADSQDPVIAGVDRNISGLTTDNDFASPDGLWFSRDQNPAGRVRPLLWIQTDDGSMDDRTNDQMLAALPGYVGDGGAMVVSGMDATGATSSQLTQVGAAPDVAVLRRFLVGPKECEITGVDTTPDGRTLFVGIQHPGEDGEPASPSSNWPQSQTGNFTGRPRSGVVAITKDDGGIVGL